MRTVFFLFSGCFWRVLAAVFLLALAPAAGGAEKPLDRVLKPGDAAPDFTLPSAEGLPVRLGDFRGKWLVLDFCPSDETPGCTLEAHNFQSDLAEYQKAGAVVLGVSPDSPQRHKEFAARQELTFPLLTDRKRKAGKRYGAWRRLALVLKRPSRATFLVDPRGRIAKIWLDADPRHHRGDVLAALAELEKKP